MNIKQFRAWCERGQALAEYMPTMAGAMAISILLWMSATGSVKGAYCKVVDAFTELPEVCMTDDEGLPSGGGEEGGGGEEEGNPEPPVEPSCTITLSSAPGTDPKNWNTPWDERNDVLTVVVADITDPIPWSLKLRFPTDPSSYDTEIKSGVFTENGTFDINVAYPAKGSWGPVSQDGYGTYESHATLHIATPCGDVGWDRWYKADWQADVKVQDLTITKSGSEYTFTTTVVNDGPYSTQIYNGQGTVVDLKVPSCTEVVSSSAPGGKCETKVSCTCGTHIICDFGDLNIGETANITAVVKPKPGTCTIQGTTSVTSQRPPDPKSSNNKLTVTYK